MMPYIAHAAVFSHGDLVRSKADPSWGGSVTGIVIRDGGFLRYLVADPSGDETERSACELEAGKIVSDPETADRED